MTDPRTQTCCQCKHFRPTEEGTGICGGVLPEVKIWGQILNPETNTIDPLFGTFRPEVKETDPSCYRFSLYGEAEDEAPEVPKRSRLCKVPGCGCNRDGESDYCADHEDMDVSSPEPQASESFTHPDCALEHCPYPFGTCLSTCQHLVDPRSRSDVPKPADGSVSSESPDQTSSLSPA
jgi:hypothetical protein